MWCRSRRFRDETIGRLDHLHRDVINLTELVRLNLGVDMSQNEDLKEIIANQTEAQSELSGLPSKIDELIAQVEAGNADNIDPELLAAAKAGSAALAAIVPNVVTPPVEPEPPTGSDPEPEPEPEVETPADETQTAGVEVPEDPAPPAEDSSTRLPG